MNEPNSIDIELEVSNNQNIEPEVSDNQDTEFEVPENEDIEYEILDNHDTDLEILAAYDSINDLSDIDNFDETEELFIGKTFQNWDQIAKLMKKYATSKGHRIRISSVISNILTSSKVCILPAQFLDNEFGTNRVEVSANCISSQSPNEISKAISKKRKFGELWGLGRKVITDAIEDNNEHIYHELLGLFTSIQKKTSQKIINNISVDGFSNNTNNNSCMLDIQNPIKRKSKSHPKSKRIAKAFEKSNIVTNYKCKICKQSGHNSQTCKEKNKEDINADNADEEFRR
ncbi:protein far1-related sequence 5-like [Gigaspora margarita]|uniref:Protein far1-related sequence 5-like n=1 Tax=Gigaspora margarita TaxID=4874 RepID=A0A8H4AXV5_GIGMA|nr:protein far1-related sequence 5-like [Gigaspora margarita]